MKRVRIITTSGSITGRQAAGAITISSDVIAMLQRDTIDLSFEEFSNIPGSHFTPVHALELSQRIDSALLDPDVHGVVVAHGTDTMEETAYLLGLTLNSAKPVVCVGAMRIATSTGYDDMTALVSAVRVAAAVEARDMGVLVMSADEIFAAHDVQQVNTRLMRAFAAPESGPVGYINNKQVLLRHRPLRRQFIPSARLEEQVYLLRLYQGMDERLLRHCITDQVAGLVIEAFGSGRIPPWLVPTLGEVVRQRIAVVVTSRCGAGGLGDEYGYVGAYHDLRRLGVLFAPDLNGIKARIKLMVALGAARNREELKAWFL
ncbi:MAG: asparaginase [Chloroflexaceae bacterium]|nr:asparaginase [Chloroflexaceae bacterium]NJO07004.1 asparaginase [Chloroflexaceae bacterium]